MEEIEGKTAVFLDQTILYPQGGGQPYDQGEIISDGARFIVEEVRFVEGLVRHFGHFESSAFSKGDSVRVNVDPGRRELNSRLHSAGHLVDMALEQMGVGWEPGKGYHFPDGPYVEYSGSLDGQDTEQLKSSLEEACNKFIQEGMGTRAEFMDKEKMKEVCHFVPDYLPEGKPARVMFFGDFGVPCGGTHVANLSEIKNMIIRKIKSGGENVIRVAYDVSRD